jgi:hypothetical protein
MLLLLLVVVVALLATQNGLHRLSMTVGSRMHSDLLLLLLLLLCSSAALGQTGSIQEAENSCQLD